MVGMADELHERASEETEKVGFRNLSHLERSAILMDGRLRALAERTIAAKSPPEETNETTP
jgi:U3 small nucleolar ribonucleoprotein component